MLTYKQYQQLQAHSDACLLEAVIAVLELHSPSAHVGDRTGDCPECQVPSPCLTAHVLMQRLRLPSLSSLARASPDCFVCGLRQSCREGARFGAFQMSPGGVPFQAAL